MSYIKDLAEATGLSAEQCELFARLFEEEAGGKIPQSTAIPPRQEPDRAPLSFAQQRLWFLDQLEPGSLLYNVPAAIRLSGPINMQALERSLNELIRRHESLRTTFALVDGSPVQIISPPSSRALPLIDLSHLSSAELGAEAQRLTGEEWRLPFNLATGPLVRATVLRLSQEDHALLLTMHHIVSDGWSMGILIREIGSLYTAFSAGQPSPLEELPIQYADYALWQRERLQGELLQKQLSYWKKQLGGIRALELPLDKPRPVPHTFAGSAESLTISKQTTDALKALAQQEGVTLFMTLLAGFQVLLYRYAGQADIAVGSPIAGRSRPELEGLIGFFINTLVLRSDLSGNPSFRELLKRVREVCLGAFSNQDVPFERLVEELQPPRDMSRHPLFQVMFVLQNTPVEMLEMPGLQQNLEGFGGENSTAKFDLTLSIVESRNGLNSSLQYNIDLFAAATARQMLDSFQQVMEEAAEKADQPIDELSLMSQTQRLRILYEWNHTSQPYDRHLCMHELFERQAEARGEAVALAFDEQEMSYAELNARANQLARYLVECGVGPEARVGICMERGMEAIISVLGVMKAGGGYVPLDPAYPFERLSFMLDDSQVSLLLTQEFLKGMFASREAKIMCIDSEWEEVASYSRLPLGPLASPHNLAYMIYTSGSTGLPKAVLIPHRGISNLIRAQQSAFNLHHSDRVLQFSSLSFDASVFEIVMALLSGSRLHLARREMLLPGEGLAELLKRERITNLVVPPTVLQAMDVEQLPELRTIVVAGEALSAELVRRWSEAGRSIYNAYGPTETTIWATVSKCEGQREGKPPIGRPIQNARVYVLDHRMEPVPVGVSGEIYIAGAGVGEGYAGRAEQTAERFVPDVYGEEEGKRMYRSGDIGRYRSDGEIEYIGRADNQVKVRGYRIELGEVEAVVSEQAGVKECGVEVKGEGGEGRLVAYVVMEGGERMNEVRMREEARRKLPEYMVPGRYVEVEEMPVSVSGKLERWRLPDVDESRPDLATSFVAPGTQLEKKIAGIWQKALELDEVGVNDNFFELGGHSLLIIKVHNRLKEELSKDLSVIDLFRYPTVRSLAEFLAATEDGGTTPEQDERMADKLNEGKRRVKQMFKQKRRAQQRVEEAQ